MDKITLDMDFGNDLEQNEDIEIPKAEKTKDFNSGICNSLCYSNSCS